MRFSKRVDIKTDSALNFVCSLLVLCVFAPFRLVINLSKRMVFFSKDSLDKVFFLSVIIGVALTAAFSVIRLVNGNFSLIKGTFPIIIMMVGCACLTGIYFGFHAANLIAYSCVEDSSIYSELQSDDKQPIQDIFGQHAQQDNVVVADGGNVALDEAGADDIVPDVPSEDVGDSTVPDKSAEDVGNNLEDFVDDAGLDLAADELLGDVLFEDAYVADRNRDLFYDSNVIDYQNRLKRSLDDILKEGLDDSLDLPRSDKGIGDALAASFPERVGFNDECMLQAEIPDVPEDFKLCL